MTNFNLLFIILFSINNPIQDLTCDDFNTGTFYGTIVQLPGIEYKVVRSEQKQIETLTKVPQEYIDMGIPMDPTYGKFEIIDKCVYRFLYDETKKDLEEFEIASNKNGGIIVEIIKIEGNCFYYTSKSTYDEKELIIEGKLCKEG